MAQLLTALLLLLASLLPGARAAEKLILEVDADADLISLAHNIDGFLFRPTMNFAAHVAGNRTELLRTDALQNHLVVTALVRIDGEIAGMATEQETVVPDPDGGHPIVESAWMFTLSHPKATGVLAVKQRENAGPTFALVQQVMDAPEKDWEDEFHSFLSTAGETRVQMARGGLEAYQGGRFEEYNFVNPADLRKFGRFRAKLRFVIYPAEE